MRISTWLRRQTDKVEHFQKVLLVLWGCHHEIRKFLLCFRVFRWLDHAACWLRTHTWDRYHMLDIRNRRNGYEWGWMDRSEGILFANMAMLVDFIEKERAFEVINWDSDDGHREAARELREIYEWWTQGRKIEHDEHERLADVAYKTSSSPASRCRAACRSWSFPMRRRSCGKPETTSGRPRTGSTRRTPT